MNSPESELRGGLSPSLVGLVVGLCAAMPMYLWQHSREMAAACFIIAGYTGWLWANAHNHAAMQGVLHDELNRLSINRFRPRVGRMLFDPGFWWTILFGGSVTASSVWYAGLHEPLFVSGICGVWMIIAISLNYGLTLVHPVTRCKRCGYELGGQLAASPEAPSIICPECNAKWSRAHLGGKSATVDWRRAA